MLNRRRTPLLASLVCLLAAVLFLSGCFVSPQRITEEEHWERMLDDRSSLYLGQELPTWDISLPEAIARAIKYNFDHRLSMMESAFHYAQLDAANLAMLPRLALNAGYSIRNNEAASRSISYKYRTESLEPSVSSQVNRINGDLSFSWSLLDFGLSYFQARQQADRYLILQERRRRILNNLIKDVIIDYLRVASLEKSQPLVDDTMKKAEEALETYRKIEVERKAPLAQTLEQERALVTIIGHLKSIQTQRAAAKTRLAALMNLPLHHVYQVVQPDDQDLIPPELAVDLQDLETIGIFLRPDLREESYQQRIDKTEVKKEMLRMIPGLDVFNSAMYDSNRYIVHNWWAEAGARTSIDIIGMAAKWKNVKNAKTQTQISRYRRLASTVAAMVQINMSYYQYEQSVESYKDSLQLHHIDNKLLTLSKASAKAREGSALDEVRQAAVTVNSRLERDRNLIDVLTAWGNLYFSVGGDILVGVNGTENLGEITSAASGALVRWLRGGLPELPTECPPVPEGCLSAETTYVNMGRIPAVFMPTDDPAAAEAFKAEEEKLSKARQDREDREEKRKREIEEKKKESAKAADLKRPDRKALRDRRQAEAAADRTKDDGKAKPDDKLKPEESPEEENKVGKRPVVRKPAEKKPVERKPADRKNGDGKVERPELKRPDQKRVDQKRPDAKRPDARRRSDAKVPETKTPDPRTEWVKILPTPKADSTLTRDEMSKDVAKEVTEDAAKKTDEPKAAPRSDNPLIPKPGEFETDDAKVGAKKAPVKN